MPLKAASYSRVSTAAQSGDSRHGQQRQDDEIGEYARLNNIELVARYQDVISGKTVTRRDLERLKSEAKDLGIQAVLISGVDRLARDVSASYRLLNELLELGLEVHASDFGLIDMSQDANVIQFSFKSLFAHLEHSGIRRKTMAARIAMAEAGKLPGGISLYGFISTRGIALPHPEQQPHLLRLFTLAANGESFNAISHTFNEDNVPSGRPARKEKYVDENGGLKTRTVLTRWHPSTVAGIVRNRAYLGTVTWGKYTLEIPQIIPAELWHKAQRHRVGAPGTLGWPLVASALRALRGPHERSQAAQGCRLPVPLPLQRPGRGGATKVRRGALPAAHRGAGRGRGTRQVQRPRKGAGFARAARNGRRRDAAQAR